MIKSSIGNKNDTLYFDFKDYKPVAGRQKGTENMINKILIILKSIENLITKSRSNLI